MGGVPSIINTAYIMDFNQLRSQCLRYRIINSVSVVLCSIRANSDDSERDCTNVNA